MYKKSGTSLNTIFTHWAFALGPGGVKAWKRKQPDTSARLISLREPVCRMAAPIRADP
ncbi:hypothetical protein J2T14_002168 [Paenibacillus harenae]|nr:hypothetical protein [Paenibacillus harenae]